MVYLTRLADEDHFTRSGAAMPVEPPRRKNYWPVQENISKDVLPKARQSH
jgi:hypothetical protein